MDEVEKFLTNHTGVCVFPMIDETTGKRSRLCGAMTYEIDGVKQPLCREHWEEVRKIVEKKNATKGKKQFVRAK